MSRGLGTAQKLILQAMATIEAGYEPGAWLYVWAIVDQAYALSPEMQERHRQEEQMRTDRAARLRDQAANGDRGAAYSLMLGESIMRFGARRRAKYSLRKRRTSPSWITESDFNPSRVLASLERRGLVERDAIQGGGTASLTDEGRRVAAGLSVGSSLRRLTDPEPADAAHTEATATR